MSGIAEQTPHPETAMARDHAPSSDKDLIAVIEPSHGWISIHPRELWESRELLYFLTWRDIKVRYKQTGVGVAWAVVQPVMTVTVFTVLLGKLGKLHSDVPYVLLVFSGMLPWTLFATALAQSSGSLVNNQQLVTKIYVPRLLIPLAATLTSLVDFLLAFAVFLVVMAYYSVVPPLAVLVLPFLVLCALATALSFGLWLSALYVKFRDIQYALPFIVQIWFFLTPVAYSASLIPHKWRIVYGLNPMTGVVQGFRWALLGQEAPNVGPLLAISGALVIAVFLSGLAFFRRVEKTFADVI